MKKKNSVLISIKGFTLIELMVAIAIIAILAAVGMVVYSSAQQTARVSKRIQDIKAIQLAIEAYKSTNIQYPKTFEPGAAVQWRSECAGFNDGNKARDQVIPGFIPAYMGIFPQDPLHDTSDGHPCYAYASDGRDYKILAHGLSDMPAAQMELQPLYLDVTRPTSQNNRSWTVYSGGARTW